MSNVLRNFLAWGFILAVSGPAFARQPSSRAPEPAPLPSKITVHVYNYARVPHPTLARAGHEARRLFLKVPIETEWLDSQLSESERPRITLCEHSLGPAHVIVNILPYSVAEGFESHDDDFGVALVPTDGDFGACAYIFYSRIKAFAGRMGVGETPLLAHTLAHEVGHLLLGLNSHSATGLMSGKWSLKELQSAECGWLDFTPPQSEYIRTAALVRNRKGNSIIVAAGESRK